MLYMGVYCCIGVYIVVDIAGYGCIGLYRGV